MREGAEMSQNGPRNRQIVIKIAPSADPKSMKNQGCAADAFFPRLWRANRTGAYQAPK